MTSKSNKKHQALCRTLLALALSTALAQPASAHLDPPGEQYATWNSVNDAVNGLWNARLTYNRPWTWGTLAANLDPAISQNIDKGSRWNNNPPTPTSVYLIPKVSIRSTSLPRGLHHLAAALLTYNRAQVAPGHFYPTYTDGSENTLVLNTPASFSVTFPAFFNAHTRSRHDNDAGYLPAVVTPACPAPAAAVVTGAWANGAQAVMHALDTQAGITNAQRWQCYAQRAAPPGVAIVDAAGGYMEFDHPDYIGAGQAHEFSDANNGRIVYDYVNGKVYYTPTHYRPSYKAGAVLTISPNNDCPGGQTCASPFFEIVE